MLYLGANGSWVFPILLRNTKVKFYVTNNDNIKMNNRSVSFGKNIELIKKYFDYVIVEHRKKIFKSNFMTLIYKSVGKYGNLVLYKINKN